MTIEDSIYVVHWDFCVIVQCPMSSPCTLVYSDIGAGQCNYTALVTLYNVRYMMEHCCYGPSHTVSPGRLLLTAAGLWTLQPGGGDGDGTIITDTVHNKLLLSPCILLLISDFRSFDHVLVSYPIGLQFTYLDFLENILLKKILFP